MRIYVVVPTQLIRCSKCGWRFYSLLVEAKNKEEAIKKVKKNTGMCKACFVEYSGSKYVVKISENE